MEKSAPGPRLSILYKDFVMPETKSVPYVTVPPERAETTKQTVEETYRSLNRLPFFMTELDETDGAGGENIALEAIRALAHEGSAVEVAQSFKEQGNNFAKVRAWKDARDCYDQALAALKAPCNPDEGEPPQGDIIRARKIEEKCHINRALCNLELRKQISDLQRF